MKRDNHTLFLYTFITVFGGILTGLYIAGISGAVPLIPDYFGITDRLFGFILGILIIGCIAGAFTGNIISNRTGRKKVLLISALLLIVGSLGSGLSVHIYGMIITRLAGGFAVGIISTVTPVYIGEIASVSQKEAFITYNQVAIVIGIFIACIINYLFLNFTDNWRWMLGFPSLFSILYLLLISILPKKASGIYPQNRTIKNTKMIPMLTGIHIILYYTPFIFNNIIYKP